jgi:hypothetical protein
MSLFQKYIRGEQVNASQLSPKNAWDIAAWMGAKPIDKVDPTDSSKKKVALHISTKEGDKEANEGDWIVVDALGQFSVYTPEEFELTMFVPVDASVPEPETEVLAPVDTGIIPEEGPPPAPDPVPDPDPVPVPEPEPVPTPVPETPKPPKPPKK